jgi:hypothetical protein
METKRPKKIADLAMRIRPDLKLRLEKLRSKRDRSVAWLVERCIEAHLPILESQQFDGFESGYVPQPPMTRANRKNRPGRLPPVRERKN